jgi:hypothetical protein
MLDSRTGVYARGLASCHGKLRGELLAYFGSRLIVILYGGFRIYHTVRNASAHIDSGRQASIIIVRAPIHPFSLSILLMLINSASFKNNNA